MRARPVGSVLVGFPLGRAGTDVEPHTMLLQVSMSPTPTSLPLPVLCFLLEGLSFPLKDEPL